MTKKRKYFAGAAATLFASAGLFAYAALIVGPFDSLFDILIWPVVLTDTEYAPKYSHSGFRKIRPGTSKEEVLKQIGPPITQKVFSEEDGEIFKGKEYWWYSRSPSDKNFFQKLVMFDSKGNVFRVSSELWAD